MSFSLCVYNRNKKKMQQGITTPNLIPGGGGRAEGGYIENTITCDPSGASVSSSV